MCVEGGGGGAEIKTSQTAYASLLVEIKLKPAPRRANISWNIVLCTVVGLLLSGSESDATTGIRLEAHTRTRKFNKCLEPDLFP